MTLTCKRCDYRHPSRGVPGAPLVDGTYSPSGFVVLSSGELECPECEGAGSIYTEGFDLPCTECDGKGTVECEHPDESCDCAGCNTCGVHCVTGCASGKGELCDV